MLTLLKQFYNKKKNRKIKLNIYMNLKTRIEQAMVIWMTSVKKQ